MIDRESSSTADGLSHGIEPGRQIGRNPRPDGFSRPERHPGAKMAADMVERVALALIERIGPQWGCGSDYCCCSGTDAILDCKFGVTVKDLARAAIEAMREPSTSMLSAAEDFDFERPGNDETNSFYSLTQKEADAVWRRWSWCLSWC